jgi:hypothetical protein
MKHHDHAIGWRVANDMGTSLAKQLFALAACHVVVIGLVVLAINSIHKNW